MECVNRQTTGKGYLTFPHLVKRKRQRFSIPSCRKQQLDVIVVMKSIDTDKM